jgi:glutathione S-transferase
MRARLGLLMAKQQVMLRAVVTKNKPKEMLAASPKGTIPVLVLPDSSVIDESLDIMLWALQQNDPEDLLHKDSPDDLSNMLDLIKHNDRFFKPQLEIYKKSKRFHLDTELQERQRCEAFIAELERHLASAASPSNASNSQGHFIGAKPSLADYALLPFVRQFSRVNRPWFIQAPYPCLRKWLETHLQSRVYSKAMTKYPLWLDTHQDTLFHDV